MSPKTAKQSPQTTGSSSSERNAERVTKKRGEEGERGSNRALEGSPVFRRKIKRCRVRLESEEEEEEEEEEAEKMEGKEVRERKEVMKDNGKEETRNLMEGAEEEEEEEEEEGETESGAVNGKAEIKEEEEKEEEVEVEEKMKEKTIWQDIRIGKEGKVRIYIHYM